MLHLISMLQRKRSREEKLSVRPSRGKTGPTLQKTNKQIRFNYDGIIDTQIAIRETKIKINKKRSQGLLLSPTLNWLPLISAKFLMFSEG